MNKWINFFYLLVKLYVLPVFHSQIKWELLKTTKEKKENIFYANSIYTQTKTR